MSLLKRYKIDPNRISSYRNEISKELVGEEGSAAGINIKLDTAEERSVNLKS